MTTYSQYRDLSSIIPPTPTEGQDPQDAQDTQEDKARIVKEILRDLAKEDQQRLNRKEIARARAAALAHERNRQRNTEQIGHPSRIEFNRIHKEEQIDKLRDASLRALSPKLPNTAVQRAANQTYSEDYSSPHGASVYQPQVLPQLAVPGSPTTALEITKLLGKLNINLNIQLTKTDTHNLLATLLTCNMSQLTALQQNPKVPVAIKTVINRLIKDEAIGNIEVIERLWNRLFGPTMAQLELPTGYQGIIPNAPVSREAYLIIRETLIGPTT